MLPLWFALVMAAMMAFYMVGDLGRQEQQRHAALDAAMAGSMIAYYDCLEKFSEVPANIGVVNQAVPVANLAPCPMGYNPADGSRDDVWQNFIGNGRELYVFSNNQDAYRAAGFLRRTLNPDRLFGTKNAATDFLIDGRTGALTPTALPPDVIMPDGAFVLMSEP